MTNIFIDARPTQLLDKKQRGIGIYADSLVKNIKKIGKNNIKYHYLLIKFENLFKRYSPENKIHVIVRKIQLLNWFFDNKLIEYIFPNESIFHSLDQSFIPKNKKYKRIVTVHDIIPTIFPKEYLENLNLVKQNSYIQSINELPNVDHIITVSQFTKKEIMKHILIDKNKISVIYEAADLLFKVYDNKKSMEKVYGSLHLPKNFILYVGGIDPRKNVESTIKVFKKISDQFEDICLVTVGSDFCDYNDPNQRKIRKLIKKYSLDKRIISLGFVDTYTLACLYNEARMMLFLSLYEGFGLPLIEAMACGCPIIASNCSCIPEITGDAVLLVNPTNIDEISIVSINLLKDKSLADRLTKKGLKRSKIFSWEKTAKQTIEVYNFF